MQSLVDGKKESISSFLAKCVEYADLSIQRKLEREILRPRYLGGNPTESLPPTPYQNYNPENWTIGWKTNRLRLFPMGQRPLNQATAR